MFDFSNKVVRALFDLSVTDDDDDVDEKGFKSEESETSKVSLDGCRQSRTKDSLPPPPLAILRIKTHSTYPCMYLYLEINIQIALAPWHSGHRDRLKNRRSRV
jgi:hypothetical protein